MEDLVLSCLESRVEENRNLYARFLVGPFLKGDALTVATALRRVLLSSVESIGITALYIQGITHEFSTIVGVRESVLELSLNFQSIVLCYDKMFFQEKSFFDEIQIGYLQVQGPKIVYANHLKLPLGIKLVDPTQYIATVSKEGSIVLKFVIGKKNNSFHPSESNLRNESIYFPILGELLKKNITRSKKKCFSKTGYAINRFRAKKTWLANLLTSKSSTSTSTNFFPIQLAGFYRKKEEKNNFLPKSCFFLLKKLNSNSSFNKLFFFRNKTNLLKNKKPTFFTVDFNKKNEGKIIFKTFKKVRKFLVAKSVTPSSRVFARPFLPLFASSCPFLPLWGTARHGTAWGSSARRAYRFPHLSVKEILRRGKQSRAQQIEAHKVPPVASTCNTSVTKHNLNRFKSIQNSAFLSKNNHFRSDICLRNIIPLDLSLTPVLKVNFVIEIDDEVLYLRQKIRERIILEVWTNGSVHPRQAVHNAALSLTDMFASFRSVYQTKSSVLLFSQTNRFNKSFPTVSRLHQNNDANSMAKLCDMPLSTTIRSQKEKQLNELQLRGICKNVLHFHSVWGIKEKSSSYKYHYKFPSKTRPSYKFSFCKANASFFSATVFPDLPLLAPACPYGPRHSTSRHVTSRRAYTLWGFPHLSVTGAKHGTAQQVKASSGTIKKGKKGQEGSRKGKEGQIEARQLLAIFKKSTKGQEKTPQKKTQHQEARSDSLLYKPKICTYGMAKKNMVKKVKRNNNFFYKTKFEKNSFLFSDLDEFTLPISIHFFLKKKGIKDISTLKNFSSFNLLLFLDGNTEMFYFIKRFLLKNNFSVFL